MLMHMPSATIRTQLALRFADGYSTEARVFSFEGLVDGLEHLTFALGDYARVPLVRLHSTPPATCSAVSAATAGLYMRSRRAGSPTWWLLLYLRRRDVASASTPSSRLYALQDIGLDTYDANPALGHREDERSYVAAAQMLQALGGRGSLAQQQPGQGSAAPPLRGERRRAGRCIVHLSRQMAAIWRRRRE